MLQLHWISNFDPRKAFYFSTISQNFPPLYNLSSSSYSGLGCGATKPLYFFFILSPVTKKFSQNATTPLNK
ncbi:hypothetical protein M8J75_008081 [Diaphorina citri]|nr:hypothetical protein M8J75_008081 [Diaphorina citri]KAI5720718.1 hypothetical protein M8J77_010834 [Diaphorina citri]